MKVLAILSVALLAAGCAGLDIRTLTPEQVAGARAAGGPLSGYVVYEPLLAVEVSIKEVCIGGKDEKGGCKGQLVSQCAATIPFLLPDYSKPYLVSSKTGFGKAGVEVTITDGWRLGALKDTSDNTAILSALGLKTTSAVEQSLGCREPGLYRLELQNNKAVLTPLRLF